MNEKSKKMKINTKKNSIKEKSKDSTKKSSDCKIDPSSSIIPVFLKPFITQQVWDQYSPIRRESFKLLMKNPSAFKVEK